MPLVVLKAIEFNYDTVTIVSSGNAAASLAAYAAKAGLQAVVFVSGNPPMGQLAKISAYGPKMVWVKGPYDEVEKLFIKTREEFRWFDCNGLINPFRLEGKKTYAHEISSQLQWQAPDVFTMVVGFGNGIVATWKGFKELYKLGFINKLPRLIGVQPVACAPIAKAFAEGKEDVTPMVCKETVAENIALGNPSFGGKRVLEAVRESKGAVISVSDEAIINACKTLGRDAGLFVEPAGALGIAGIRRLLDEGLVDRNEVVVPVITGHGVNNQRFAIKTYKVSEKIEPKIGEINRILRGK
jgi:threonine synthase